MRTRSPMRRSIRRTLSCGLFGIGVLALGASAGLAATPPPMSTLPDILNGERHVLPVDDILLAQTFKGWNDSYAARYVELGLTSNSAITQLVGKELASNRLASYGSRIGPELIATGRLYRSNTDVGVTFTLSDSGGPHLETTLVQKSTTGTELSEIQWQTIPMVVLQPRAVAVADFTGDGLHEVAFHAGSTDATGSRTIIGTAADSSVPGSSLRFGPEYVGGPAYLDMKAGDLNGDGRPELIGLYATGGALHVVVHTVDPTTLQILDPPGNDYLVAAWKAGDKARLAVGKFDDDMGDAEIVVVHGGGVVLPGGECPSGTFTHTPVCVRPLKVHIAPTGEVSFTAAPAVDIGPSLNGSTGKPWNELVGLEVATGKLNWFGGNPRDQMVVGAGMYSSTSGNYKGYAAVVVSFVTESTNPMSVSSDQVKASAYNNAVAATTCLAGVAVGRFSPPSPDASGTPTNSQVALLFATIASGPMGTTLSACGRDTWPPSADLLGNAVLYWRFSVGIYTVDPAYNYKITLTSSTAIAAIWSANDAYVGDTIALPRMAVGDLQGRSLLLGPPTIISVAQQIQPQFVIGAPPMHLDYFTPTLAQERPECYASSATVYGQEPTSSSGSRAAADCIQNVSAYPGHSTGATACDYCAKFSISGDATKSGEQETVTSHTWSNEIGGSASLTYGTLTPNLLQKSGFQVEAHGSAKWMHSNTTTTRNEVMAKTAISLATSTGPDDYVLFSSQDVYLYMYPVIGQTDDNGNPIYLHFSVPDQTEFHMAEGSALPWWQPPHEVGNIFSYAGNRGQLLADYPGVADRSGAVGWTSQTQQTSTITWTVNQTTAKTMGSVDQTDWNVGGSVTGAVKIMKVTLKGNAKYDHNESTANKYTNTNKKSLSASEGFSITTGAFTTIPESVYRVEARILGSETPTLADGYWDDEVPMPDPKGEAGEGFVPDLNLDGPMQVVYTTNMLSSASFLAGDLWNDVYGVVPDIALQHPKRFLYKGRASTASMSDWWIFNPLYSNLDLSTVHAAEFLKMKGFFINPASAAPGQGPQMTMAEDGTKLRLAARIYNYSLVGLPAGATVKVRFYAQRLAADLANHYDLWAPGGCTLIGEDSVLIDGFRSDPLATTATNRAMAETIFDTTDRGGQYLAFWVVAWAENADGTLVPELPQHGLSSEPPAGCPAQSILDMPMEFYSNNVGFYEQPFYIMAKALAAAPPRPAGEPLAPFSIGALTVLPVNAERPYAGELWQLEAPLQAGGEDAVSVHLLHAGAGPGGRVSNTGMIPFIEAGQMYVDRLTFRPLWCGPHGALVAARPAFHERVNATVRFEIPCRPQDVTAFFNDVLTDASLAGVVKVNTNGHVEGRLAALQNSVLTAERLAHTGATKGACTQYAQALARVADAGNGPMAQLLEDIIDNAREQLGCR